MQTVCFQIGDGGSSSSESSLGSSSGYGSQNTVRIEEQHQQQQQQQLQQQHFQQQQQQHFQQQQQQKQQQHNYTSSAVIDGKIKFITDFKSEIAFLLQRHQRYQSIQFNTNIKIDWSISSQLWLSDKSVQFGKTHLLARVVIAMSW